MNYAIDDTQPLKRITMPEALPRRKWPIWVAAAGVVAVSGAIGTVAASTFAATSNTPPSLTAPIITESPTPDVEPVVITTTRAAVPTKRSAVPVVGHATSQGPVTVTRTKEAPVTDAPTTTREAEPTGTVTATLPPATGHTTPTNPTETYCDENPNRC